MIPPNRTDERTDAERRAEWQARCIVTTILDAAAGAERRGVGSLAFTWDVTAMLLGVLRKEAARRGVSWEHVEDALHKDAMDWERNLFPDPPPAAEGAD